MQYMRKSLKKHSKIFSAIVVLLAVLATQTSAAFAVQDYTGYTNLEPDGQGRTEIPVNQVETAAKLYNYMMNESGMNGEGGFNQNAVLGIIANGVQELDLLFELRGDADRVGGFLQWTDVRYDALLAYADSTSQAADTMECQVQFLIISENFSMGDYSNSNGFDCDMPDGVTNVQTYLTYPFATPEDAAEVFCWGFEMPTFRTSNIIYRLDVARSLPSKVLNSPIVTSSGSVSFQEGWYSEYDEKWGVLKKEQDSKVLILPDIDNSQLSLSNKMQIGYWADSITSNEASSSIKVIRGAVTAFGIILMVYCTLLYLSYWFDRINNFIELNVLGLLTFGKLSISQDEATSTFSKPSEKTRLVNHRNMCFITILGVQIGVIIVSGKIYYLISMLMSLVSRFIT